MLNSSDSNTPNILVVNDTPDLLELIAFSLKSEGYNVLTATSGHKALDIAESQPIELVISDVVMPEMDGIELCSRLKKNPDTKHIPVLLASAMRTEEQDSVHGLYAGADDYLEMPFRQTELLVKIARLIERSRMERVLRDSERRYRALYQNSPLTYFVFDQNGFIVSVNQTGIDRLGFSEEELTGKPIFDIFLEKDRPQLATQIEKLRQSSGGTSHWEAHKVSKNGNIVFASVNVRLLPQDNGGRLFLPICEDINKRKHTEEGLRESKIRYKKVT